MGNRNMKEISEEDYQECCAAFNQYLSGKKNEEINVEKQKNETEKKFDENASKNIIERFIKNLLEKEKKEKILNNMIDVFVFLNDLYEVINKKEDDTKTFSDNVNENEKNIINAIYISKIFEDDDDINDVKIHDYAVYLYGEDVVEEIEEGNNKNINEDFKNFNKDDFEITEEEINAKFIEFCQKKGKNPDEIGKKENSIPQNNANNNPNNNENNNQPNSNQPNSNQPNSNQPNSNQSNSNQPNSNQSNSNQLSNNQPNNNNNSDPLYKDKFKDQTLSEYYDIVFDIDSLENLKKNGWKFEATEKGFAKYNKKKDKKNTVVSVIGNKNKGKSFILAKISKIEIPDGHNITTKGLSIIYPQYDEKNIIFLDTAGFEIPLCEDDNVFKFKTSDENLKKNENTKLSIKDIIKEDEYIEQIMKFTRDRQNTDYFLQKFIMNSADILLCIVNKIDLSDQKFLNRIQDENKDKKIFIIHNLKTFKKKNEVQDYIDNTLLKLLSFRLQKSLYTSTDDNNNNSDDKKENNIFYKQIFENNSEEKNVDKHREVIHLFMANDGSEAGNFYNESTINCIKDQIIAFTNNNTFPIIEKVRDFLFEHSEDFFNEELENIDDLKISEGEEKLLKYNGKDFVLKECYVDELGNTNFIQSNYKPNYRVYKAKYKDNENNNETIKLIIDIEISGKVEDINIEKVSKNRQNIITVKGKRKLGKETKKENDDTKEKKKKFFGEHKSSYFNESSTLFNLRIFIPNEKCIIGDLYKEQDFPDEGLYRFIYNIQDKTIPVEPIKGVVISSDEEDIYSEEN